MEQGDEESKRHHNLVRDILINMGAVGPDGAITAEAAGLPTDRLRGKDSSRCMYVLILSFLLFAPRLFLPDCCSFCFSLRKNDYQVQMLTKPRVSE
jgi:hypothetical protein